MRYKEVMSRKRLAGGCQGEKEKDRCQDEEEIASMGAERRRLGPSDCFSTHLNTKAPLKGKRNETRRGQVERKTRELQDDR